MSKMIGKIAELSPLRKILMEFPQGMKFCFAYGSGVFQQNNNHEKTMLDLIFVVKNPQKWHEENLYYHPKHYAQPLRYFGAKVIAHLQDNWGARIYYNTLVKTTHGPMIKYGTISESALIEDLLDWNNLYIAGRLHKPVKVLIEPDKNSQLPMAIVQNLNSAVHAALLLLPEHFTEIEFYEKIAGLSYSGDFRMIFGENKNKISNIVLPQLLNFRKLYSTILKHFDDYIDIPKLEQIAIMCRQDTSPRTRIYHLNHLPRIPQVKLVKAWSEGPKTKDMEDCLRVIAYDPECSQLLAQCLKQIVWRSSITQSLKGISTAGIIKSVEYSGSKIVKMFNSNSEKTKLPNSKSENIKTIVDPVGEEKVKPKNTNKYLD